MGLHIVKFSQIQISSKTTTKRCGLWTIGRKNDYHIIGFQETRFRLIHKLLSICLHANNTPKERLYSDTLFSQAKPTHYKFSKIIREI
jgi:hypothetical protein